MPNGSTQIVHKLWSYCNVLRDDGLSYQDYLEQLTFLLFLKMADERASLTGKEQSIPKGYPWADLAGPHMEGVKLEQHYRDTLAKLGVQGGMLGLIFEKAQNKIQDPAKLRQLIVELIGKENWLSMSADVKGGAGQYFTPRSLIQAIVDCVQPAPGELIVDPACGTGGFLLAVHDYLANHYELDRTAKRHLRFDALRGVELVPGVSRLCAMNLFLHGVGPDDDNREPPIRTDDALRDEPDDHFDVVATNPPFGKKSSITVVNEEGETDRETLTYNRPDFWTTTSNKQLNFVQLEGANVVFFDRKPGAKEPWTKKVWVYDLRTNKHFTLKTKRMTRADLDEFVECFKPGERQKRKATWSEKNPEGRWRTFGYDEIVARDKVSLDLFWLRDESLEDSANLPDPNILAQEIADDLRSALGQIEDILGDLEQRVRPTTGAERGSP